MIFREILQSPRKPVLDRTDRGDAGVNNAQQVYNISMKDLTELKGLLHDQAPYLAEKYGVCVIGVFGSYVRNEQRPESDLDVLIELDRPPKISLIGLVELEHYLSKLLGVRVDIAIKKNLKKRMGERILREVIPV